MKDTQWDWGGAVVNEWLRGIAREKEVRLFFFLLASAKFVPVCSIQPGESPSDTECLLQRAWLKIAWRNLCRVAPEKRRKNSRIKFITVRRRGTPTRINTRFTCLSEPVKSLADYCHNPFCPFTPPPYFHVLIILLYSRNFPRVAAGCHRPAPSKKTVLIIIYYMHRVYNIIYI